jgi:hypothetical protein
MEELPGKKMLDFPCQHPVWTQKQKKNYTTGKKDKSLRMHIVS